MATESDGVKVRDEDVDAMEQTADEFLASVDPAREDVRYLTKPEPMVLGESCWYWVVAGKQFVCAFRGEQGGPESLRARAALLKYVKGCLPEPQADSASVVGPCCVPEGGDIPKPISGER